MPLIAALSDSARRAVELFEPLCSGGPAQSSRFGMGWIAGDGLAACYNSPLCPADDTSLPHLLRSLSSPIWLFNPTIGHEEYPLAPVMAAGEWLWTGASDGDGTPRLHSTLLHQLDSSVLASIGQLHLSALLFAYFRQLLDRDQEMTVEESLAATFELLQRLAGDQPPSLAAIICDGQRLHGVRVGDPQDAPGLYYCTDSDTLSDTQLLAGSPMESGIWHPLPSDHRITLAREEPPELLPLQ